MNEAPILFGPFRLEPAASGLLRDGAPVALGSRALTLLLALAEARGQILAKTDLMERVWPGQIVEEGNLTVQIAALRKAMGTDREGRDWILTVPRKGYRLIGGGAAPPVLPSTPVLPSLAVMPFQNLGGDPEQDYFADGVVEDIITALGRFKSFAVIARNSSFIYKSRAVNVRQAASELGVRYVLEGSVRRAGDTLRISAHLNDAALGTQLWAEKYEGVLEDVFAFQDKITESVAWTVEPQIQLAEIEQSRRERPGSAAAYDFYLRALPNIFVDDFECYTKAYELLAEAIKLEPANAVYLAYTAFALFVRNSTFSQHNWPGDQEKCAELALRAMQIAQGDATVMSLCGISLIHLVKDYNWGVAALQSAVESNPNSSLGVHFAGVVNLHCGSIDDALACFERALRLSPRDPHAHYSLSGIAHAHMIRGDYSGALAYAARSFAVYPSFQPTYWLLIAAHAQLGQLDETHRYIAILRKLSPGVSIASIWAGQPQMDTSRMANIFEGLRLAGLPEG